MSGAIATVNYRGECSYDGSEFVPAVYSEVSVAILSSSFGSEDQNKASSRSTQT